MKDKLSFREVPFLLLRTSEKLSRNPKVSKHSWEIVAVRKLFHTSYAKKYVSFDPIFP